MARSLALLGFCIAIQIFAGLADKLFLSIDCGETVKHSDGLGINWIGDDGYMKAGKAAEVQNLGIYSREHNSLRYFPSQKKSCYLISGVTTGRKHTIRAHFFYGNNDGKSWPPSFDLQFDGNHWASVTSSSTESYYSEVVYAPKGENISVCLARTSPNQTPFISILVIREFELGMYETDDEEDVLLRRSRIAFGAKDLLRYPDDPYDRYWYPSDGMDGVISVARDNMSFIQDFQDIPGKALVNAITPASSTATNLTVPTSGILSVDATYYYIFYFMEVLEAAYQNTSRSFDFLVDGIKRNGDPIIPPYQSYWFVRNRGRYLTTGSLPPILNAMEVFRVQRGLAAETNADESMNALKTLQGQYQLLQLWAGDPCLPVGFTWDWLNCNANDPPRITELHLNGLGLTGTLPDLSSLTALEIIDLSNNSLSGAIPDFLGAFPHLKELNLADNNFTGHLPASLAGNQKVKLNIKGNNITEDNPSPQRIDDGSNRKIIIEIVVPIGSIIILVKIIIIICCCLLKRRKAPPSPGVEPSCAVKPPPEVNGSVTKITTTSGCCACCNFR